MFVLTVEDFENKQVNPAWKENYAYQIYSPCPKFASVMCFAPHLETWLRTFFVQRYLEYNMQRFLTRDFCMLY